MKYNTVGKIPKINRKIVETEVKSIKILHRSFSGLIQAPQKKIAGLNLFDGPKTPPYPISNSVFHYL